MRRKMMALCLLIAMALLLGAARAAEAAEIRFTDARGKEIVLDGPAERVISLYSAHTENLFALGAGERLIGGSNSEVYPEAACALPVYHYREDPEKVIAAMPDLVLVRPMIERVAPEYIAALERAGLTVASLYPDTADQFDGYIRTLAMITGTQEQAEALLLDRDERIRAIAEKIEGIEPVKVFFETSADPLRTLTDTALAAVSVRLAGGMLMADDAPENPGSSMVEYPMEKLLEKGEEIQVYVAQSGGMNKQVSEADICERPGYSAIRAVREGHVTVIDEKMVASPTFRQLDGIELLAAAFDEARN